MTLKRIFLIISVALISNNQVFTQINNNGWFSFPGLGPESPLSLTSEETFYGVIGAAALSYTLTELVFKNHENLNFYQIGGGMNNEYFWGLRKVFHQNFGVEKRAAPWFAFALEYNFQQWGDQTPKLDKNEKFGLGMGIMTYYRWYLFGKKRLSPYLEYGTGLFWGFKEFPYNGTAFTFNHSTQVGLEYTFENKNKARMGYGQFHQSNNYLFDRNPGYDGNGFNVSYSWFWKTSKW